MPMDDTIMTFLFAPIFLQWSSKLRFLEYAESKSMGAERGSLNSMSGQKDEMEWNWVCLTMTRVFKDIFPACGS